MAFRNLTIGIMLSMGVAACTATNPDGTSLPYRHSVSAYYNKFRTASPEGRRLTVCHGHSCQYRTSYKLTDRDVEDLKALFRPGLVVDGQSERAQIQKAVALMERRIGHKIGTKADLALNRMLMGAGDPSQTDCVDEAANTTSVILALNDRGLIRHHTIEKPALRDSFWAPHYTAVVRDNVTGVAWAIDSWFTDNGVAPLVMTVDAWYSYRRGAGATNL